MDLGSSKPRSRPTWSSNRGFNDRPQKSNQTSQHKVIGGSPSRNAPSKKKLVWQRSDDSLPQQLLSAKNAPQQTAPYSQGQPAQRSFRNRTKHFRQFLPLTTGSPKRDFRLPGSQKFIQRDKSSPPMPQGCRQLSNRTSFLRNAPVNPVGFTSALPRNRTRHRTSNHPTTSETILCNAVPLSASQDVAKPTGHRKKTSSLRNGPRASRRSHKVHCLETGPHSATSRFRITPLQPAKTTFQTTRSSSHKKDRAWCLCLFRQPSQMTLVNLIPPK
jgi:hypothetical protein